MALDRPSPAELRSVAPAAASGPPLRARLRRFAPVAVIVFAMLAVFASGAHRHLSLETLVQHRMAIDAFMTHHMIAALGVFVAVYIVVVALSIPGALFLTITGGILFGALIGGAASITGATIGATLIFLIARSACGENIVRRAGPLACKIAEGFRQDAFSYLLFLRLVPAFPFFLVNLVPAVAGVKLRTFMAATAVGIVPATFAFAFFGSGLDSVIAAQEGSYRACIASARSECPIHFDLGALVTPQLLAAFAALGALALIPVIVKRLRRRHARQSPAPLA
jgi:uncharacterized membrane protein YdjX (TVP38/TMEM64 family)